MNLYTISSLESGPAKRSLFTNLLQFIEPVMVTAVGLFAILSDRLPQETVVIALAFLLAPPLLRFFFAGRMTTPTLANVPIFLFLILLIITCWVTPSWHYTWPEMARMVWGIALYLAVINWINPIPVSLDQSVAGWRGSSMRLIIATAAFFAIGVVLTTIGILGIRPTFKIEHLGRVLEFLPELYIAGVHSFNSNNVAGVIVLFAPFAFALAVGPLGLHQRSRLLWLVVKIAAILLALLFSVSLLLTQTRGAWLAFAIAAVLILASIGRRGWLSLAVLAVMAAGILYVIGPSTLVKQLTVQDSRTSEQGLILQDRNLAARIILWERAIHGLADAPLTGMGLGAFQAVSQRPYPQVNGFTPDSDMTHVHNLVLQAGVDFGVPGVIALVSLFIISGRLLVILIHRAAPFSLLHTWGLGLGASFMAFIVYNMANATTLGSMSAFTVWFLLGLCVGAGEWAQRNIESGIKAAGNRRVVMSVDVGEEKDWTEWENRAWTVTSGTMKQ